MNPSAAAQTTWHDPGGVRLVPADAETAARDASALTDDVLLQICRMPADDPQVTPEWLSRVRLATRLLGDRCLCPPERVEAAMTLLASALGKLEQFNPTHLPFGYGGQEVRSRGWMERRALERAGKQIVGLMWRNTAAEAVAVVVERAVSEGIRLGFLEQRQYDAWRPGMRSGSGWRWAVTATPYGVARAALLANDTNGRDSAARELHDEATEGAEEHPKAMPDSANAADGLEVAPGPTSDREDFEKKQYRKRLLELRHARGLSTVDRASQAGLSVQGIAARLADELDAWVEAISNSEADRHPSGGYWTALGDDMRDMLGPAELATGVFEDDWTPLLTQLRMSGLSELAETLDGLAEAAIPQAQELARDMDAVAYLRSGGPRDAFYELYAKDDLATHEGCAWQGRQDVARSVMRIVGALRTLAKADGGSPITTASMPARSPRPQPRRGTRTANIEKLEKELEKHLLAARDHAHSLRDRGREPALLPRPNQKELARRTGLSKTDVSRCINDKRATVLKILWETADSLEAVMTYKRRR